jgi:F0F1-type ATP synthase delta subunit
MIETDTDPAVIGGVVINLGEYYIDMSTATKVKRISSALKGEAQ